VLVFSGSCFPPDLLHCETRWAAAPVGDVPWPCTVLGQLGRTVEQSVLWRTPLIFCMRKAEIFASLVKALAVGQPSYFSPELARHCTARWLLPCSSNWASNCILSLHEQQHGGRYGVAHTSYGCGGIYFSSYVGLGWWLR
jgi:hypothetical protein